MLDVIRARCSDGDAGYLVDLLARRKLPLHVLDVDLRDMGSPFLQGKMAKRGRRTELEGLIAERLETRSCEVLVDLVQTDPPRPSSSEPGVDPESIYVETDSDVKEFSEVSDIFKGNPLKGSRRLLVFVPFREAERERRLEERSRLRQQVTEVIQAWGEEA